MHRLHSPIFLCVILSLVVAYLRIGDPFFRPDMYIVGGWNHPDNLGNHWLAIWVAEQMATNGSLLHNDQYYVPFGDYPWLAGNGSEGFLFFPLYMIFGWPTGLGIMISILMIATGLAGYYLGRQSGAGKWGALLTSAVCLSSPYLQRELTAGRFSQFDIFWFLLAVGSYIHLLRIPLKHRLPSAVFCGLTVALTAIFYWFYGFFFLLTALVFTLMAILCKQPLDKVRIGLAVVVAVCISSPILLVYLWNWSLIPGANDLSFPVMEAVHDSLTLSGFFVFNPGKQGVFCLPITCLLFLPFAIRSAYRSPEYRWVVLGAILLVFLGISLALGTNGFAYEVLYGHISILKRFWWPSRHVVLVFVAIAILSGIGLTIFLNSMSSKFPKFVRFRGGVALFMSLSVPLSLWIQGNVPFQAQSSKVVVPHDAYVEISHLDGEGIWQPPLHPRVAFSQAPLIFQYYHQKKMLNGHALWVDRVRPVKWDQQIEENALLFAFYQYEVGAISEDITFSQADIVQLRDLGITLLVLDDELFKKNDHPLVRGYAIAFSHIFGEPVGNYSGIRVWSVDNWNGKETVPVSLLPKVEAKSADYNFSGPAFESRMFQPGPER